MVKGGEDVLAELFSVAPGSALTLSRDCSWVGLALRCELAARTVTMNVSRKMTWILRC